LQVTILAAFDTATIRRVDGHNETILKLERTYAGRGITLSWSQPRNKSVTRC